MYRGIFYLWFKMYIRKKCNIYHVYQLSLCCQLNWHLVHLLYFHLQKIKKVENGHKKMQYQYLPIIFVLSIELCNSVKIAVKVYGCTHKSN